MLTIFVAPTLMETRLTWVIQQMSDITDIVAMCYDFLMGDQLILLLIWCLIYEVFEGNTMNQMRIKIDINIKQVELFIESASLKL